MIRAGILSLGMMFADDFCLREQFGVKNEDAEDWEQEISAKSPFLQTYSVQSDPIYGKSCRVSLEFPQGTRFDGKMKITLTMILIGSLYFPFVGYTLQSKHNPEFSCSSDQIASDFDSVCGPNAPRFVCLRD
jgi:hypothetical protein